jgi:uncharacterized membrane protein YfcA
MPLSFTAMLIAPVVMFVAYIVLAVGGFGSALISIPLLALFLPVKLVIPLVLLVDFVATAGTGLRFRRDIALDELKPIIVPMMLGLAAGVTLLVQLPARWVLLALGLFIFGYGAYSLFAHASQRRYSKWWSLPVGLSGGVISGLFGMGGPMYVIYLSGRIAEPARLRATLSTMFTLNTGVRLILFLITGLLLRQELWIAALYLLPFMALGLYAGHRLHVRMTAAQIGRVISVLLLLTGVSILSKAFMSA